MKYALIKDGIVENIIEVDSYRTSQLISQVQGMDEAVYVDLYAVSIGCSYNNGVFTDTNGAVIERQKTSEERIVELEQKNQLMQQALDDLILGGAL
jgi:uncharacterized protein (DUF2164 family)